MKPGKIFSISTICLSAVVAALASFGTANLTKDLRLTEASVNTTVWATRKKSYDARRSEWFTAVGTHITRSLGSFTRTKSKSRIYPGPTKADLVNSVISTLSTSRMSDWLSSLTTFHNRYYTTLYGLEASIWVSQQLVAIAASEQGERARTAITVYRYKHPWFQFSVIAKLHGSSASAPTVIVSAHLDSINADDPESGRAPGADDNGSGVVTLLEVFRALIDTDFFPSCPIEFHFYSGEEAGQLGSKAIAAAYRGAGQNVLAVLNLDQIAYLGPQYKEVISFLTHAASTPLNEYLRSLARTYCSIPTVLDPTEWPGMADHESWYDAGYDAAVATEAFIGISNKAIHTADDTSSIDGFSWSHALVSRV